MKYSVYEIITLALTRFNMGVSGAIDVKEGQVIFRVSLPDDFAVPGESGWHEVVDWNVTGHDRHYISRARKMFLSFVEGDIILTICYRNRDFDKEMEECEKYYKNQM